MGEPMSVLTSAPIAFARRGEYIPSWTLQNLMSDINR